MSSIASLLPIIRGDMSKLKIPHSSDKVYKDECMFSFDSPFSDAGLYVNIITYKGFGKDYLAHDMKATGCKLYLHEVWRQVKKEKDEKSEVAEPTKLAIGVAGGFMTDAEYDVAKENYLVVVNGSNLESIPLPCQDLPEFVSNVAQAIIDHEGMKANMQVSSWDADNEKVVSKYAKILEQVNPSNKRISQDPKQWRDEATGATDNLWLNLSTGYIGGGRKNWDGSGGSGSALDHYIATGRKYPLVVKLGTITPHGADVYSYAADEDNMVIDPLLAEHLSYWGIDVMKTEKTEKTVAELEVALNMSYDWTKIVADGEEVEPVTGPGLVGLRNLGSSCYMNSVMQSVLAIPEVQERYLMQHEGIVASSPSDPSTDFAAQMSKLATGVLSSRYVPPAPPSAATSANLGEEGGKVASLEKYVVAPRMFKHLVGKGHPEFSSGRQQDVSEYFQYFLEVMAKAERTSLPRVALPGAVAPKPTPSIFEYHVQERYHCPQTGEVKYSKHGPSSLYNLLDLPVPMDQAVQAATGTTPVPKRARLEVKEGDADAKEWDMCTDAPEAPQPEPEPFVPFSACLQRYLQHEEVRLHSPTVGDTTTFLKAARFETFPRYLMVKMSRYYVGANWVQVKINARIDVPEELDLSTYRATGPQPGENIINDAADPAGAVPTAATATEAVASFQVSAELVGQLTMMGFSENGCKRAAIATRNADAETAMNWIFEHMEDPDFNDPPALPEESGAVAANASATATADPEAIMMLTSMGYTETQVAAALQATDNNIERAADWLFSHAEDLDAAVAQAQSGAASASGDQGTGAIDCDDGEGKYTLMAIISHIGKNTDHGHYVCHIKKDGQWIFFNDEKVAKCTKPPLEHGFLYLYRRNDGPGTFAV